MTKEQELKLQLIDKFANVEKPESVDFCKVVYDWLAEPVIEVKPTLNPMANLVENTKTGSLTDGIYYVLEDGSVIPFIPDMGAQGNLDGSLVRYIGVKWGGRSLKVALHDQANGEDITLTAKEDTTKYDGYIDNYLDAVADWKGQANTEHLKQIGLSKDIVLADGEYIPGLGEMYFVFLNRRAINQALELIGSEPIADDWYWTSTELSATRAWLLSLDYGTAGSSTKASYTLRVRAVSAFIS